MGSRGVEADLQLVRDLLDFPPRSQQPGHLGLSPAQAAGAPQEVLRDPGLMLWIHDQDQSGHAAFAEKAIGAGKRSHRPRCAVPSGGGSARRKLLEVPVDGQVESRIEERERVRTEDRVRELLSSLLPSLPAEDRLLLKLHYWDNLSIAAASLLLGRPQRELYSARTRCLKRLRRYLEEAGVDPDQARRLQGQSQLDLASCAV